MSDELVMVQPVRTYIEGADLVHPESEPYAVTKAHAIDLMRNGLVIEAPAAVSVEPEPPQAGGQASEAPETRKRPSRVP